MPALEADLELMRTAALAAGELALSYQDKGAKAWDKSPGNPVTEADIAVNQLLIRHLVEARPDYGWLSEETQDDPAARQKHRVWVVDPIDGTRAFMREDDPYWCIAIALIEDGEAVAGLIHAPRLDELYMAHAGGGAFLNDTQIRVSECEAETGCRMIAAPQMIDHKDWPEPWPDMQVADPKPNATLLRMAFVAAGTWDATIALARKSDWDLAAGTVLVREAGGLATTHLGEPFTFNGIVPAQRSLIAAGGDLHPLLVQRVRQVSLPDPSATEPETKRREPRTMSDADTETKQLLHIVIGGVLRDVSQVEFDNLDEMHFVGAFPNYKTAYDAWKNAAHSTVDNAEMRYFILHAHKLMDPETGTHHHV